MDSQGLGLDPQFANNSCDSQQNLRIYADLFFFQGYVRLHRHTLGNYFFAQSGHMWNLKKLTFNKDPG